MYRKIDRSIGFPRPDGGAGAVLGRGGPTVINNES